MKRYKITVAYDGTNYCGWQIQPNGLTIEEVLNETLSKVLKQEITIIGASRTDAGVHALGNVAVFDAQTTIPAERIGYAINPALPEDIRIVGSKEVAADYHPRYQDTKKTYEYHIENGTFPYPTLDRYAHFVPKKLNVDAMNQAGKILVGTHDFKSFCASKTQAKTTVRTVSDVWVTGREITPQMREIIIHVTGEGFLYNMVRIIAGTLIKVGLGVYPPEYVKDILEAKDRSKAGETVPAKGLLLHDIQYLSEE